jgi:hypothetical protein
MQRGYFNGLRLLGRWMGGVAQPRVVQVEKASLKLMVWMARLLRFVEEAGAGSSHSVSGPHATAWPMTANERLRTLAAPTPASAQPGQPIFCA